MQEDSDALTSVYMAGWNSIEDYLELGTVESQQKIVSELEGAFPYLRDASVGEHHSFIS